MINKERLPVFFVVGAQKAGTTTLHNWLIQQPDVCLPKIKETHFFSDDERYNLGMKWYLKQFPYGRKRRLVGEIDPDYLFYEEAPERIINLIAEPKLIFIFRNPLDRAYSHYLMSCRRGYERLPFTEALYAERDRASQDRNMYRAHFSYMARGSYPEQIRRYLTFFPKSQMFYIKFDDFFHAETGPDIYQKLCSFIGVKTPAVLPDFNQKANIASMPRSFHLRNLLYGGGRFKKILGRLIPSKQIKLRIALFLDALNQIPVTIQPDLCLQEIPHEFIESAKDEIDQLQSLSGLDCSDWVRNNREWRIGAKPVLSESNET